MGPDSDHDCVHCSLVLSHQTGPCLPATVSQQALCHLHLHLINPRARMRKRRVIVVCRVGRAVGQSVNLLVCDFVSPHVFSRTVAAVDTKR